MKSTNRAAASTVDYIYDGYIINCSGTDWERDKVNGCIAVSAITGVREEVPSDEEK